MPMYFGRKAHIRHGVPMREERSGKAFQADLDARAARAALTWRDLDETAWKDEALRGEVAKMRSAGHSPHETLRRFARRFDEAQSARASFEARRAAVLKDESGK